MRLGAEIVPALLLALAAGPAAVRAEPDVPGSGGALTIAADPPRLVLGRDAGADLRISAPPEVTELAVTASAGRVDGIRRLPAGGFAARYHAPSERHPQVAVLAAVARAGAASLDGWLAVPLAGQGDARVRGTPGADVSLRIGDRSFGPARVGADGVAVLPVVVPPGVREGHQGFTAVDLRVPETTCVHGALDRTAVAADRPETVRFYAYVIAPHGAARGGEAPRVEPTRGTVALRAREPGAFEGTWTLPPGPAGEERLTIRLEGFPASRVALRLNANPGPPAAVAVAFDRPALVAGRGNEVVVTARAIDAAGNPTAAAVVLTADAGTLTQEDSGPGAVRGVLRLGPDFEGRSRVVVRGRVPSSGAAGEAALPLQPGPPARVAFTPEVAYAFGDGRSEAVLSLAVHDAHGNPVSGPPKVAAGSGPAPRIAPGEPGTWAVRVRGDAVDDVTRVPLQVDADGARGEAELWLVPARSRQLAFLGAAGVLVPTGGGQTGAQLLLGAELPMPELVALGPARTLALRVELAATNRTRSEAGEKLDATTGAILVGPVLKGLFPGGRWFASGTVGLLVGSGERVGGASDTGVAPALRLGVGLSVPVRRASPFLEAAVLGAGSTPAGAFTAFTISVGIRLDRVRAAPGEE
jgi:cytochrome c5